MDKIITAAKDLGRLIQNDERFYRYMLAEQANEDDLELQAKLTIFDEKRSLLMSEAQKEEKDAELMKQLDKDVKSLYEELVNNEKTLALNAAQEDMQKLLNSINQIIGGSATGLDPETIDYTAACSPSGCAGCKGC